MISRRCAFTVALICLVTFATVLGAENRDGRVRALKALLDRLRSPKWQESEAAFQSLETDRWVTIEALLRVLRVPERGPDDYVARMHAMEILGEYRAVEAVDVLIAHLTDVHPFPVVWDRPASWDGVSRSERHPLRLYPAAFALVQIGNRSMRPLLDRLTRPVNDDELRIMAFVIYMIDGKDLGLARLKLAVDGGEYKGPARDNLARLYDVYKTTDFRDMRQWPRPKSASPDPKDSPPKADGAPSQRAGPSE